MPVCKDKKIIFIHVPKTAGTTIEASLGLFNSDNLYDMKGKLPGNLTTRQHLYGSEIVKSINVDATDYYKFSVVRNPFDRLVSAFYFIHNQRNMYIPTAIKHMSFEDFIRYSFNMDAIERKYIFDGHLELQSKYIDIENVEVFKFENISNCFDTLNVKFGPLVFEHYLKTNHRQWQEYYTSELMQLVYNFYKEDFERFDYPYVP